MPTSTTNFGFQKPLVNDPTDEDLWGGYLNDDLDDIDAELKIAQDGITPIGLIAPYAGTAAPSRWILCYGQAISRVTYASLFAITGTTYGSGDGSTTFNLPDLRGRVVAGQDDMGGSSANRLTNQSGGIEGDTLGATGGAETHTLTEAQMPEHNHQFNDQGTEVYLDTGTAHAGLTVDTVAVSNNNAFSSVTISNRSTNQAAVTSTGSGEAHNNVQPTIILNYIIYAGV